LLTDGVEWELWVRPRNDPLELDDNGEYDADAAASLREALGYVKPRNLENHSYHPHNARGKLNENAFAEFTATAVLKTIQNEFDVDVPSFQ
jgi:hypothetical protein